MSGILKADRYLLLLLFSVGLFLLHPGAGCLLKENVVKVFSSVFHGAWLQTLLGRLGFCMLSVNVQASIVLEAFFLVVRCLKMLYACFSVASLSLAFYARKTFTSR